MSDATAPVRRLETSAWAFGAVRFAVARDLLTRVPGGRADDPVERATEDVLAALDLLRIDGDAVRPGPVLEALTQDGTSDAVSALVRTSWAQLSAFASGAADGTWGHVDPEVLQQQGRASGIWGRVIPTTVAPLLPGLSERLAAGDAAFLDVGVGVAAISIELCRAVPGASAVGLDVLPAALELARANVDEAGLGDRIELRLQGVEVLDDEARFDLAWVPRPFLPQHVFRPALRNVLAALRPGGWVLVPVGTAIADPLERAVANLRNTLNGSFHAEPDEVVAELEDVGFADVAQHELPSLPIRLVAARRPVPQL